MKLADGPKTKTGESYPRRLYLIFAGLAVLSCLGLDFLAARRGEPATFMGTEATMVMDAGKLLLYPEITRPNVQAYGSSSWPKAARKAYFEANGYTADGKPATPLPPPKEVQEGKVERGPSHYEWFIISLREGKPSRENATEGHYAAGAAHIANMAYRHGCRMRWNFRTGKVNKD